MALSKYYKTNESINEKYNRAKSEIKQAKENDLEKYLDLIQTKNQTGEDKEKLVKFMLTLPEDYAIDTSENEDEQLQSARKKLQEYETNNLEKYLDIIQKAAAWNEKEKQIDELSSYFEFKSIYERYNSIFKDIENHYFNAGSWDEGVKRYLRDLYKNNPSKYQTVINWAKEEKHKQEVQAKEKADSEKAKQDKKAKEQKDQIEKEERKKREKEERLAAEFMASSNEYKDQAPGSEGQRIAFFKKELKKYHKDYWDTWHTYQKIMKDTETWLNQTTDQYIDNDCIPAYKEALVVEAKFATKHQLENYKKNDSNKYNEILLKTAKYFTPYMWNTQVSEG